MNKKGLLIIFLLIVLCGITFFLFKVFNYNKITVSCDKDSKNCLYEEKTILGTNIATKEFSFNDVMQCNVETIYKKDKKDNDIVDTYDFYLYINSGNDVINFKSKNSKTLASICSDIFERKNFKYDFCVKK